MLSAKHYRSGSAGGATGRQDPKRPEVVIAKDDYELYRRKQPGFLQVLTGQLVTKQICSALRKPASP